MDLIEIPEYSGLNHILGGMDHLSKFGYVYPVVTKTSEEVDKSLLCILATSIIPSVLQSDNRGEVSVFSVLHNHFYRNLKCDDFFPFIFTNQFH
jgi:hypothetical protein